MEIAMPVSEELPVFVNAIVEAAPSCYGRFPKTDPDRRQRSNWSGGRSTNAI